MKQILILFFALFVLSASAQVPDTMFVEMDTATISTPDTTYLDTFFLVAIGTKNATNKRLNIRYVDARFDSAGVAMYAFRQIKENEDKQGAADRAKLQASTLTRLYGDVDRVLRDFTGEGYLKNATRRYNSNYVGFFRASLGDSASFFRLLGNGGSVEVDEKGKPVQGGYNGTWDAITENRFRLVGHFPTQIVPAGTVFTRVTGEVFASPSTALQIEKLK